MKKNVEGPCRPSYGGIMGTGAADYCKRPLGIAQSSRKVGEAMM
jgi:hypothetical protein